MNLKNKLFITFLFLIAFILFFNINNVFAFSFTCNTENHTETIDLPDVAEEYQSYFNLPYIIFSTDNVKFCIRFLADNESFFYINQYGIAWSGTIHQFTYDGSSWDYRFNNNKIAGITAVSNYYYFNSDIYTDVDKSNYFFTCPVTGVVIPALETAKQIPQAIVTTLRILIPVGLVVLLVGLVICLIKRVIYLTK